MTTRARIHARRCVWCGKQFLAAQKNALYCSVNCTNRAGVAARMLERTTPPEVA